MKKLCKKYSYILYNGRSCKGRSYIYLIYIYISTRVLPFLTPTWFRLSDLLQE